MKPAMTERLEYLLLHDFCTVAVKLEEQFSRFRASGDVGCPILEDLMGRQRNRGPLWQMKDTAHILARRDDASEEGIPALLDASLGAIFHTTRQVQEIAWLQRAYLPEVTAMSRKWRKEKGKNDNSLGRAASELGRLLKKNARALAPAVKNLEKLLEQARLLVCLAYQGKGENVMVASMARDEMPLVKEAFRSWAGFFLDHINAAPPAALPNQGVSTCLCSIPKSPPPSTGSSTATSPSCTGKYSPTQK